MNTVVTLNLARIGRAGAPLPAYAVADLIPVSVGRAEAPPALIGLVLELGNRRKLQERINVPAGSVVVNVRFPNGALLSQQVEADGSSPSISFALTKQARADVVPTGDRVQKQDSLRSVRAAGPRDSSDSSDKARWRPAPVYPTRGQGGGLRATLEEVAKEVVNERQGGLGVVRLQGLESTAETSRRPDRDRPFDSASIVGEVQTLQPIKLYGHLSSLSTQWKMPIRRAFGAGADPAWEEGRHKRYFAIVYRANDRVEAQQIACIPGRWKRSDGDWATVNVTFDANAALEGQESRIRIDVQDPEYGVMLQYLQTGDIESSYALFEQAKEGLRGKYTNPYAAAAGGYVLLYSGLRSHVEEWSQWVANLSNDFRALPDGPILLSTLLLQTPAGQSGWLNYLPMSEEQVQTMAFDAAMDAVRRGPPLYRLGLTLLAANLQILAGICKGRADRIGDIKRASSYVQSLSLRADPTQPFCVFDVDSHEL